MKIHEINPVNYIFFDPGVLELFIPGHFRVVFHQKRHPLLILNPFLGKITPVNFIFFDPGSFE